MAPARPRDTLVAVTFDAIRFEPAARRFKSFFDELNATFAEREDVLAQISLALVARQHVLIAGPPGTAKSQLASAVFGRIVDEETGRPSLYARQIGESTVRTDLVGPLNFKTLMETGRSEHFTDEGMLGAVHAFLDEVFDGRDMLLRDALNVLQERELKQGSHIVKGRIECALMTSNRYLVEVLEGSRDTLLAFVDRIAFAGFVPRSFATEDALASVLCRHVGRGGTAMLVSPLTVQDIDELQAAVDEVTISDAMCRRLALLLARFDAELLEATRADPSFIPTRYLSTRTAVGAGKLLRAIVIVRRIFDQPGRRLAVTADDFRFLYLHLLLCGPTMQNVQTLIARERDPRERRQLQIVQTERLIFERVMSGLPAMADEPAPAPPTIVPGRVSGSTPSPSASAAPPLRARLTKALSSQQPKSVLDGLSTVVEAIRVGELRPAEGQALLDMGVSTLNALALAATLAPHVDESTSVDAFIDRLVLLADQIELATPSSRGIARWLRGRAIALLDEGSRFSSSPGGSELSGIGEGRTGSLVPLAIPVIDRARQRLTALVARDSRRKTLRARGAEVSDATSAAWAETVRRTEEELLLLWDEAVCKRLSDTFSEGLGDVSRVVTTLTPLLTELAEVEITLQTLGAGQGFRGRVVGPRLTRLLDKMFSQLLISERSAVAMTIVTMQQTLDHAGLCDAVPAANWVRWAADALLGSERVSELASVPDLNHDRETYMNLRRDEQRVSNAYSLAEVALRSDAARGLSMAGPSAAHARVVEVLAALSPDRRIRAVELDVARMDRALTVLEGWWARLVAANASPATLADERFIEVAWDGGALLRFALEARTLADLFPDEAGPAQQILARAEALHEALRAHTMGHLRERADAAWRVSFPEASS
jgi:MoxR-like ATPase